jgi:hypothetical protein
MRLWLTMEPRMIQTFLKVNLELFENIRNFRIVINDVFVYRSRRKTSE